MSVDPNASYLYQAGGSLPSDAPTYVMRQADKDLYNALLTREYCYVLNARQMGKSSLRVRTMERLRSQGIACAEIELSGIGSQQITATQWYGGIIQELISGFALQVNRRNWLREHEDLSPVQRLGEFIDQIVLPQIAQPLVIFIDEIDSVRGLNFPTDEFFALIRHCYEKRAIRPDYRRLSFVMLGVATPSDLIQDQHVTPFNIGRAIELQGLQFHESVVLAQGLKGKVERPQAALKAVLSWTGGQPFLTQKLCWLIATMEQNIAAGEEEYHIAQLVRSHLIDDWEAQDEPEHLRTIRDRLLKHSSRSITLLRLYQQILNRGRITAQDTPECLELRLSGLVKKEGHFFIVNNQIYQAVFNATWVTNELRRLQSDAALIPGWMPWLVSMGVAAVVLGVRSLGLLQPFELTMFDQLMRQRSPEPADHRILIITVREADIQYQDRLGMERRGSLSDQALSQLLQKLSPHQPRVIGLDIFHDFTFTPDLADQLSQNPRFIATCEIAQTVERPTSIAAPPGIPEEQLGFADFPLDAGYIIRRQLLAMPSLPACPTTQSFSLGIALNYLSQTPKRAPTGAMQVAETIIPKLTANAGGYQLSQNLVAGYQTLINYRTTNPQQVSLQAILDGSFDQQLSALVRDRIILIGVADAKDLHLTPYTSRTSSQKASGVIIHAQMISQIISAVLDERPLIWWLPEWAEGIWITGWSVLAGILTWQWYRIKVSLKRPYLSFGLTLGGALGSLYVLCFIGLLNGGWLPLVPSVLTLLASSGGMIAIANHREIYFTQSGI
jgi:CHASE2 domain-containing sensor protein